MRRRAPAAGVAIGTVLAAIALLCAGPALGQTPPPGNTGNGVSGGTGHHKGNGKDPCEKQHGRGIPPFCQQAPEAPAALLYPAAAVVALSTFWLLERRRRSHRRLA